MRKSHVDNPVNQSALVEDIELTEKFTFNPKEGIDNPALVISDDSDYVSKPMPRLCVLKSGEDGCFGFHLRIERGCQGHVIRNMVALGPAERSGLQDGDRLLEVNETFVDNVPHSEVARLIRRSGSQLCLLVLDGQEYDLAWSQGEDLRALARAHRGEATKPPRLCHINRDPDLGLGIHFTPVEGEKGRFAVNLLPGSAAERAGVCQGDRLVWMNGAAVSELTPSALGKMVKKCEDHMTIMVIDEESEQSYITRRMPILPAMALPTSLLHRPRKLHLALGPTGGYGFLLRQEWTPSGCIVHVLREVDTVGPAAQAGMQEGDLLLEVNGELVDSVEHTEVVHRVRLNQQVTLTTITNNGLQFYKKLGLSPLLFCESDTNEGGKTTSASPSAVKEEDLEEKPVDLAKTQQCVLQTNSMGFSCGINLGFKPKTEGGIISQATLRRSGKKAGQLEGGMLIEVNGPNVVDKCFEDVIILMKEGGHLSLLVKHNQ